MIPLETKLIVVGEQEKIVEGYFLTVYDMVRMVRDFQVDSRDGFVSNDISYLEEWLKKCKRL